MIRLDVLIAATGYFFILFGGWIVPNNMFAAQRQNINNILHTKNINPLNTEDIYELPRQNYILCPLLHSFVWSHRMLPKNRPISQVPPHMVSHSFTQKQLAIISEEYRELAYNPENFPITYRSDVSINIDNSTANRIYYIICKDYYRGEPSHVMPVIFSAGMIIAVTLHILGYV